VVLRKTADAVAIAVAIAVVVAGVFLVVVKGPSFDPPAKTTTTVEIGTGSGVGKKTETTEVNKSTNPKSVSEKSSTAVEQPSGEPAGKRTTTVEDSPRSFTERVLGESGLILLQIGIILLAAFLAGAFTQRVLLGDFALKLGGLLELGAVQEKAEQTLVGLTAKVAETADAQAKQQKSLEALADNVRDISAASVNVGLAIAQLRDRIEKLESGERRT
jgi:uncharacterized coiled-coil protein SlyX